MLGWGFGLGVGDRVGLVLHAGARIFVLFCLCALGIFSGWSREVCPLGMLVWFGLNLGEFGGLVFGDWHTGYGIR